MDDIITRRREYERRRRKNDVALARWRKAFDVHYKSTRDLGRPLSKRQKAKFDSLCAESEALQAERRLLDDEYTRLWARAEENELLWKHARRIERQQQERLTGNRWRIDRPTGQRKY